MKRIFQSLIAAGVVAVALLVASPTEAEAGYRTVQAGQDLYKMFGSRGFDVCRINNLPNCNLIFPGQVLNDGLGGSVTAPVQHAPVVSQAFAVAPQRTVRASGGPNAYGYGWCTWWVKEKRPDIGSYWGNAISWLGSAQAAGYATGSTPVAGAIAYSSTAGPLGHVAYVESVNADGSVNISEMGWNYQQGNLNYRTVPASSFSYIYFR